MTKTRKKESKKALSIIPLEKSALYAKTQELTKDIIAHYQSNLSAPEFEEILFNCLKMNAAIAQASVSQDTPHISYLFTAHRRFLEIRKLILNPSANIMIKIDEINIIFFKIRTKYKNYKEKERD